MVQSFGQIGGTPTIFLLAKFAISPKYFVTFCSQQNILVTFLYHHFFTMFSCHQMLVPYHQIHASFQTKCVAKRPQNDQFSAYITKSCGQKMNY